MAFTDADQRKPPTTSLTAAIYILKKLFILFGYFEQTLYYVSHSIADSLRFYYNFSCNAVVITNTMRRSTFVWQHKNRICKCVSNQVRYKNSKKLQHLKKSLYLSMFVDC